jgi:hypothetical protein
MPTQLQTWARAWKEYHPGWTMILWTDDPAKHEHLLHEPWDAVSLHPPVMNRWVYTHAQKWFGDRAAWAARSDILRYEIVAQYGGVYSDLDFEPFRCIETLLKSVRLFNADEWGPCCGNYLFGAERNHSAMWTAVRELVKGVAPKYIPAHGWKSLCTRAWAKLRGKRLVKYDRFNPPEPKVEWKGILETTGPFYLASKIHHHPDCVVFPWQLFNPLPAPMNGAQVRNWPDHAAGNHHYAGTWYERNKIKPPAALLAVEEEK